MKQSLECIWYGLALANTYNFLNDYYFRNVKEWQAIIAVLIAYLLGDYLMVKFDRWRIKRKVRKAIIRAIKEQGLNPDDFEIGFGKAEITETDDPDYDVLTLTYKDKDEEAQ